MGGGQKVNRGTKAPLNELIKRLEKPWQFVETGKAYWIGYTDDMYLIADYKNDAIRPLVNFIDTAKNIKAREGGLYTLHLIGIDEKVVGRFSENFVNKDARLALLQYLNDNSLHETVVYLLMRDPWLSDIPQLMEYLSKHTGDYSKLLSALQRYDFKGKPIGQNIDPDMVNKEVTVFYPDSQATTTINRIAELVSYQKEFVSRFQIDNEIIQSSDWIKSNAELSKIKTKKTDEPFGFSFSFLIRDVFNFCDFQESFFYTFSNHKLTLYGPTKTRQIWLDWWSKASEIDKNQFYAFRHIPFNERYK